ncbi:MAG: ParB/RepB/Spo0J family partition protein [Candidatus Sumerlaea chitinivorans]|nr:ParB/RepB/Spo0J family partition protein [Candidatus Sumerlaea chitinivorans]
MQSKKRGLGKGLAALLPVPGSSGNPRPAEEVAVTPTSDFRDTRQSIRHLPVSDLAPNPFQPREVFDEEGLRELAESVRVRGVIQPVLVARRDSKWVLVAGERRWRAAQLAGLEHIPAIELKLTDQELLEYALIENLQRENLNPIEEARAYQVLIERFGLTHEEVASRVEKSRPAVANTLRLLNLPDILQQDIEEGRLSAGHGRALLALPTDEERLQVRNEVLQKGLSVRDTEALVLRMLGEKTKAERKPRPRQSRAEDEFAERLRNRLEEVLACRVQVKVFDSQRGKIEIHYTSLDELDRICAQLGVADE